MIPSGCVPPKHTSNVLLIHLYSPCFLSISCPEYMQPGGSYKKVRTACPDFCALSGNNNFVQPFQSTLGRATAGPSVRHVRCARKRARRFFCSNRKAIKRCILSKINCFSQVNSRWGNCRAIRPACSLRAEARQTFLLF